MLYLKERMQLISVFVRDETLRTVVRARASQTQYRSVLPVAIRSRVALLVIVGRSDVEETTSREAALVDAFVGG
jgi:hypothetical protein